jgi:hypothetical protein
MQGDTKRQLTQEDTKRQLTQEDTKRQLTQEDTKLFGSECLLWSLVNRRSKK